jgi:hypothetical protein
MLRNKYLDIERFLLFLQKHGSVFNIADYLHDDPSFLSERDLNQSCLAETDCVTSMGTIQKLTGGNPYLKEIFNHPHNFYQSRHKKYMSDKICHLLSQIHYPSLIQIDFSSVVEFGSHVLSIIAFENKCYLIQSYAERYTYTVDIYPTLSLLLNYFSIMFDEVSDLNTKISIYNKLTHNEAHIQDYQHNLTYNKEINIKYGPNLIYPLNIPYQPGTLFIDVSDFHLPSVDVMRNILSEAYIQTKDENLPKLNQGLISAMTFLVQ